MGTVELKIPQGYLNFLNHVAFSEAVNFVFRFTKKCFPVDYDDLDDIPMEGLDSKHLRIHLESAKDV